MPEDDDIIVGIEPWGRWFPADSVSLMTLSGIRIAIGSLLSSVLSIELASSVDTDLNTMYAVPNIVVSVFSGWTVYSPTDLRLRRCSRNRTIGTLVPADGRVWTVFH